MKKSQWNASTAGPPRIRADKVSCTHCCGLGGKRIGMVRGSVRARAGGALPHGVGDGVELDGEGVFEIFPLGGIEDLLDGVRT